jgi:hypothetical protein
MNLEETKNEISNLVAGRKDFQLYSRANLPRKVEALIDHRDFQSKLSWIAKQLDASLEETQQALDLLESLEIISWENGVIKKLTGDLHLDDLVQDKSKGALISEHRIISHQLLNDVDEHNRFFVRNGFTATDHEVFNEYYAKLYEVQKWFMEASAKSKKNLVVGFSLTGANVIKSNGDLK